MTHPINIRSPELTTEQESQAPGSLERLGQKRAKEGTGSGREGKTGRFKHKGPMSEFLLQNNETRGRRNAWHCQATAAQQPQFHGMAQAGLSPTGQPPLPRQSQT